MDLKNGTLLICEDNEIVRIIMEHFFPNLVDYGEVVFYDKFHEARTYISENKVDCIILDNNMDERNGGYAMLKWLKNNGFEDIPVIFNSSLFDENILKEIGYKNLYIMETKESTSPLKEIIDNI